VFGRRSLTVLVVALLLVAVSIGTSATQANGGTTRHYYIQAEDQLWDFAPSGIDQIHGGPIPAPWTKYHVWSKTRYVEYTDATYATRKPQPEWLGVLGPVIRAEVGDTIVVHFRNHASGDYGMHPHGVRYDKDNEGAHYSFGGAGADVPPGGSFTYTWFADAGSGPGPNDPTSLVWWYHSHVDEPAETNAGLLGPIVITAKGMARADATPVDVDREFVLLFMIFNEDGGKERGLMHSINGYIFGNVPGLVAQNGEHVRWYVLGMGNEVDLHTAHWHAKTLTYEGRHTDVIELLPGSMATADMVADNPGTWLIHCHVADHIDAGMLALYTIR
jgi:FtsP/CotA-like multicopper oxidase with cupredoxin domain